MKEFIENLIERLEELKTIERNRPCDCDEDGNGDAEQIYDDGRSQGRFEQTHKIIEIVNQLAEEYKTTCIEELLEAKKNCGEDSNCSKCPFGQIEEICILTKLQIESGNNGWILTEERLPDNNRCVLIKAESTTIAGGTIIAVGACHNGFWFVQNGLDTLGFPCDGYKVVKWREIPKE